MLFGFSFSIHFFVEKHSGNIASVIVSVLVDLTNTKRTDQNLQSLKINPILTEAAQMKANDMAEKGYFSHTSPDGKSPWHWFIKANYRFIYAGENLAVDFSESEDVVNAWLNSEDHRENLLNGKFSEIGIAVAKGKLNGRDTLFVVQMFGHPLETNIEKSSPVEIPRIDETEPSNEEVGSVAGAQNIEVIAEEKDFIAVQNNEHVEEIIEIKNPATLYDTLLYYLSLKFLFLR
jgi:hypothetical protein